MAAHDLVELTEDQHALRERKPLVTVYYMAAEIVVVDHMVEAFDPQPQILRGLLQRAFTGSGGGRRRWHSFGPATIGRKDGRATRRRARRLSAWVLQAIAQIKNRRGQRPSISALLGIVAVAVEKIIKASITSFALHVDDHPDINPDPVRSSRKVRGPNPARRPIRVVMRDHHRALSTAGSRLLKGACRARPEPALCT